MTEKEFHKLRRRDLLQLLVAQGKENIQLQSESDETKAELAQLQENYERLKKKLDEKDAGFQESNDRLKARLNEKDALIEKLKGRLDQKDARIRELREQMEEWLNSRRIELEEAGSIAEAALRLSGIFQVAQQAAEHYLYNIRVNQGLEKSDLTQEMKLEPEPEEEELVWVRESDLEQEGEVVEEADSEREPEKESEPKPEEEPAEETGAESGEGSEEESEPKPEGEPVKEPEQEDVKPAE